MVLPPADIDPSWAAASIPRAIPLTTVIPRHARWRAVNHSTRDMRKRTSAGVCSCVMPGGHLPFGFPPCPSRRVPRFTEERHSPGSVGSPQCDRARREGLVGRGHVGRGRARKYADDHRLPHPDADVRHPPPAAPPPPPVPPFFPWRRRKTSPTATPASFPRSRKTMSPVASSNLGACPVMTKASSPPAPSWGNTGEYEGISSRIRSSRPRSSNDLRTTAVTCPSLFLSDTWRMPTRYFTYPETGRVVRDRTGPRTRYTPRI